GVLALLPAALWRTLQSRDPPRLEARGDVHDGGAELLDDRGKRRQTGLPFATRKGCSRLREGRCGQRVGAGVGCEFGRVVARGEQGEGRGGGERGDCGDGSAPPG